MSLGLREVEMQRPKALVMLGYPSEAMPVPEAGRSRLLAGTVTLVLCRDRHRATC